MSPLHTQPCWIPLHGRKSRFLPELHAKSVSKLGPAPELHQPQLIDRFRKTCAISRRSGFQVPTLRETPMVRSSPSRALPGSWRSTGVSSDTIAMAFNICQRLDDRICGGNPSPPAVLVQCVPRRLHFGIISRAKLLPVQLPIYRTPEPRRHLHRHLGTVHGQEPQIKERVQVGPQQQAVLRVVGTLAAVGHDIVMGGNRRSRQCPRRRGARFLRKGRA